MSWRTFFLVVFLIAIAYPFLLRYKAGCNYLIPEDLAVSGKVALITGGNGGVGLGTASQLAALGIHVILSCRSATSCNKAAENVRHYVANDVIAKKRGFKSAKVSVELANLASLSSVRQLALRVRQNYPRLDYLINNAGIMGAPFNRTEDGHEMHFGVNHLSHFLLTKLLLPHMKKSGEEVRVLTISSLAHYVFAERVNLTDPGITQTYSPFRAYGQSKLVNVLFARELARRENEKWDSRKSGAAPHVVSVSVHPGAVATEIGRHMVSGVPAWLQKAIHYLSLYTLVKTPLEGSQTSLHCALDPSLGRLYNGAYFADCIPRVTSLGAQDDNDARDLWRLSEELTVAFCT